MSTQRKPVRHQGRKVKAQHVTLTSGTLLSRGQKPSPADIRCAINCLYKAAAHVERNESYADHIAKESLSLAYSLDLLRAALVLICKKESADTVWEIVEYILAPALNGLCQGQRETGNIIGTGMARNDGRDHLRDLTRDEGEPLRRIIDAIARNCPQGLYGHPESDND